VKFLSVKGIVAGPYHFVFEEVRKQLPYGSAAEGHSEFFTLFGKLKQGSLVVVYVQGRRSTTGLLLAVGSPSGLDVAMKPQRKQRRLPHRA
jgi:hypothetical protein